MYRLRTRKHQNVSSDNLLVTKRDLRSFCNTVQKTQIFNACILVEGCRNSITPYVLNLRQKLYGQKQRA
jgi:hypothetical protein